MDVFLKFNKTDKVEQFEEKSASHAHANIHILQPVKTSFYLLVIRSGL